MSSSSSQLQAAIASRSRSSIRTPSWRWTGGRVDSATLESVTALVRSPRGTTPGVGCVLGELARILEAVEEAQARKGHALSAISEPGFWERDERFELLAEAEDLDPLVAERGGGRLAVAFGAASDPTVEKRTRSWLGCWQVASTSSTERWQGWPTTRRPRYS